MIHRVKTGIDDLISFVNNSSDIYIPIDDIIQIRGSNDFMSRTSAVTETF